MRKLAEKVAIVALICTSFVFVLMSVLYSTNIIPQKEQLADNAVSIVVLSVLFAIFLGLSVYLLIVNFSEMINIKRILLYYEVGSATYTNHKVVNNMVRGCVKEFPQFKLKRVVFRMDDKRGLVANITLKSMVAEDIAAYLPQLKTLITESFKKSLGLKLNAINFVVVNLSQKFSPQDTLVELARETPAHEAETTTVSASETEPTETAVAESTNPETTEPTDTTTETPSETPTVPLDDDHKQDDIAAGEDKQTANA